MKFPKTINLLKTTSDNKNLPRLVTKNKVYDRSERIIVITKKIGLIHLLF